MDEDGESKRLSYFVSALVHLSLLLVLLSVRLTVPPPPPEAEPRIIRKVRLVPPPGVVPPPARPVPTPPPVSTPRDRISIGAESDRRQKEALLLERDVEITKERIGPGNPGPSAARAGVPDGVPSPTAAPSTGPRSAAVSEDGGDVLAVPRRPDPRLTAPAPGTGGGLRRTLETLDRRLAAGDGAVVVKGGGQRTGPLLFDPRGADFTAWVNHWRSEVYRNWLIPQPALLGLRGHVDLEFTVRRDGTVVDLKILKVSGVPAFDKAAANAILASRLLVLPADYDSDSVTMQATFFYNEDPRRS